MEAKEDGKIAIMQEHMVEAHMIQHFQSLNSSLAVEEVVVVVLMMIAQVEGEVMEDQLFVYLPSIRLHLMVLS